MKKFINKSTAVLIIIAMLFINLFALSIPVNADNTTLEYVELSSDGILTVKGSCDSAEFQGLLVDNGETAAYYSGISGEHNFTFKIDTKEFNLGFHTLSAELSNGQTIYAKTAFPSAIYDAEKIAKNSNFFTVGSNFICFTPYFTVNPNFDGLYLQVGKGDTWGDVYGPFKSYTGMKITKFDSKTKLKPNTEYKVRVFYYKNTTYGEQSYPFFGPISNIITVKTGQAKAPSIKSISAKCVSQKKIKLHSDGWWDASGHWIPPYNGTTWTTTFKVTVKLKKKPGSKGLYIAGKKVKGNKTTYTVTIKDSGKLKGKKLNIGVCTYNDDKVGSYSPSAKKSIKIK